MNDYFLSFSSHFDRDQGLDRGRLRLDSLSKGKLISGLPLAAFQINKDAKVSIFWAVIFLLVIAVIRG